MAVGRGPEPKRTRSSEILHHGTQDDFSAEVEEGPSAFFAKTVIIARAMKSIAFTPNPREQLWLKTFSHAKVLKLEGAGHYLREDAHEKIVPALLDCFGK